MLACPDTHKLRNLPQLLPIVIFGGKPSWQASQDVHKLIDRMVQGVVPYGTYIRYLLVDAWCNPRLADIKFVPTLEYPV